MFYKTQTARRPLKSPPDSDRMVRLLLHDVVCSERVRMHHAAERTIPSLTGDDGSAHHVLSLVTLTYL